MLTGLPTVTLSICVMLEFIADTFFTLKETSSVEEIPFLAVNVSLYRVPAGIVVGSESVFT